MNSQRIMRKNCLSRTGIHDRVVGSVGDVFALLVVAMNGTERGRRGSRRLT